MAAMLFGENAAFVAPAYLPALVGSKFAACRSLAIWVDVVRLSARDCFVKECLFKVAQSGLISLTKNHILEVVSAELIVVAL